MIIIEEKIIYEDPQNTPLLFRIISIELLLVV
nr:MAG TPA: hypothetical protein [Bacteriophage sp.]